MSGNRHVFGVNDTVLITETNEIVSTDWLPPMPDVGDFSVDMLLLPSWLSDLGSRHRYKKSFALKVPGIFYRINMNTVQN